MSIHEFAHRALWLIRGFEANNCQDTIYFARNKTGILIWEMRPWDPLHPWNQCSITRQEKICCDLYKQFIKTVTAHRFRQKIDLNLFQRSIIVEFILTTTLRVLSITKGRRVLRWTAFLRYVSQRGHSRYCGYRITYRLTNNQCDAFI